MTRGKIIVLAVVVAAALAFLVERLIVTDREAITTLVDDAAAAVNHDDWDAVAKTIDDAYSERGNDKQALVAWAKGAWNAAKVRPLVIEITEIRVDGDRAAARVIARPGTRLSGLAFPGRIDLVRRSDGWKIDGVAADDPSLGPPSGSR